MSATFLGRSLLFGFLFVSFNLYSQGPKTAILDEINSNMVLVEGGTFLMGCQTGDDFCDDDEKPAHEIIISSFAVSKYEVTQAQWKAITGKKPSAAPKCKDCPVESISWNDAQAFIQKLNAASGESYRLPTEAEWEFASRGGRKSKGTLFSGSKELWMVAHYQPTKTERPIKVGGFAPNELGLYDMNGNVFEWCQDWYDEKGYAKQAANVTGVPFTPEYRVLRGGSWASPRSQCRITNRGGSDPDSREDHYGMRLAKDVQ